MIALDRIPAIGCRNAHQIKLARTMKTEQLKYDRVASREEAFNMAEEGSAAFVAKMKDAQTELCSESLEMYVVIDRVRLNLVPMMEDKQAQMESKQRRYKKISQDWLKVFPLVPRLREVINQLHRNTNEELHDRHRDAGHGEHRSGD